MNELLIKAILSNIIFAPYPNTLIKHPIIIFGELNAKKFAKEQFIIERKGQIKFASSMRGSTRKNDFFSESKIFFRSMGKTYCLKDCRIC